MKQMEMRRRIRMKKKRVAQKIASITLMMRKMRKKKRRRRIAAWQQPARVVKWTHPPPLNNVMHKIKY
jgi:hypothetical protein